MAHLHRMRTNAAHTPAPTRTADRAGTHRQPQHCLSMANRRLRSMDSLTRCVVHSSTIAEVHCHGYRSWSDEPTRNPDRALDTRSSRPRPPICCRAQPVSIASNSLIGTKQSNSERRHQTAEPSRSPLAHDRLPLNGIIFDQTGYRSQAQLGVAATRYHQFGEPVGFHQMRWSHRCEITRSMRFPRVNRTSLRRRAGGRARQGPARV